LNSHQKVIKPVDNVKDMNRIKDQVMQKIKDKYSKDLKTMMSQAGTRPVSSDKTKKRVGGLNTNVTKKVTDMRSKSGGSNIGKGLFTKSASTMSLAVTTQPIEPKILSSLSFVASTPKTPQLSISTQRSSCNTNSTLRSSTKNLGSSHSYLNNTKSSALKSSAALNSSIAARRQSGTGINKKTPSSLNNSKVYSYIPASRI